MLAINIFGMLAAFYYFHFTGHPDLAETVLAGTESLRPLLPTRYLGAEAAVKALC